MIWKHILMPVVRWTVPPEASHHLYLWGFRWLPLWLWALICWDPIAMRRRRKTLEAHWINNHGIMRKALREISAVGHQTGGVHFGLTCAGIADRALQDAPVIPQKLKDKP